MDNQQMQSSPPPPSSSNSSKTFLLIAGTIALMIISAAGGYFIGARKNQAVVQNNQISISPKIPQPSPTLTATPFVLPTTDPSITANWNKYRNEEFMYSVQYPFGWEVIEAKPKSEYEIETLIKEENEIQKVTFLEKNPKLYQGHFQIRVLSNPNNSTLEQWVKDYKRPLLADPSTNLAKVVGNTTLNGRPAIEISINSLTVPSETAIVTMSNNYIYYVGFDNWSDVEADKIKQYGAERLIQINDQILSTFQFTN